MIALQTSLAQKRYRRTKARGYVPLGRRGLYARVHRSRCCFKIEHQFIHVAPAPCLAEFSGANNGMSHVTKVLRGVLVLRRVAAAEMTARHVQPQMHPGIAER